MGKLKRSRRAASKQNDIVVVFNIDAVPPEDREPLLEDTRRLRDGLIAVAYTLIDAGERFTRWKQRLPHGAYLPWVATTGYSEQSAWDASNVYKRFRDRPTLFTDLDLALPETAIVHLSGAPETALEDVADRIREGESLDLKTVKSIIRLHKRAYQLVEESPTRQASPNSLGAASLRRMADAAHADLAKATETRLAELLHFIHDAEARLASGRKFSFADLEKFMRPRAQWLTEALEQITQRRAISSVKLLHKTSLDRPEHDPGPWSDTATFLRDIGHSDGWERLKATDAPELLLRGRASLEAVLPSGMHRSFAQY